jgi:kynurenine formamidase
MAGRARMTIDEMPLEWCFQRGVKLDFRAFPDGYVVTAQDVEDELKRIGHDLQPLDIVLVNTAAGMALGRPTFVNVGCGMGYEATMYLTTRGVRVTGTDAWSWDAPFTYTAQKVAETGDTSLIWEGHKAGRDIGYCHLEKLHNLEALPPTASRSAASPQDQGRVRRVDPRRRHHRGLTHAPCNLAQWAPRWRAGGRLGRWRALSFGAWPDLVGRDRGLGGGDAGSRPPGRTG